MLGRPGIYVMRCFHNFKAKINSFPSIIFRYSTLFLNCDKVSLSGLFGGLSLLPNESITRFMSKLKTLKRARCSVRTDRRIAYRDRGGRGMIAEEQGAVECAVCGVRAGRPRRRSRGALRRYRTPAGRAGVCPTDLRRAVRRIYVE